MNDPVGRLGVGSPRLAGFGNRRHSLTIYEETDPEYPPYLKNLTSERGTQGERFEARWLLPIACHHKD